MNVTVVPGGYLGYLTTWPTGKPQPNVSTLNSWTGKVVANAALVPAGTGGSISVFAEDATDVILDTNGYFGLPGAAALNFYPVAPCRVADTRGGNGPFGGPKMDAAASRSFPIPSSGCGYSGDGGGLLRERDRSAGWNAVLLDSVAHGRRPSAGFNAQLLGRGGGGQRGHHPGRYGRGDQRLRDPKHARDIGHKRIFRAVACRTESALPRLLQRLTARLAGEEQDGHTAEVDDGDATQRPRLGTQMRNQPACHERAAGRQTTRPTLKQKPTPVPRMRVGNSPGR